METSVITFKPKPASAPSPTNVWLALDAPEEWTAFSQPHAQGWDSRLMVEGMHCAACAMHVEKALKSVPGVVSAEVNASAGRARVIWSDALTKPSEWAAAIERAGYHALPAADALSQDKRRKAKRVMLWRWLVAGFCMMQVMMYAYPAYIAKGGDMTTDMLNLMRWASWLLTLPVMIFSCGPFFKSAWHDLQRRQISMDLPVALGIWITFLVSSAATFDPKGWWGHEVYFDSLTMFVFFLLTGRWIELFLRDKTAGALEALMHRLPQSVQRKLPNGTFEQVAVRRLQVGDVVRVFPGEAFPADGEILLGETTADEALLTGESRPVSKPLHAAVVAGSHNVSSMVEVLVQQVGDQTQYAQIVALMERVSVDKPRLALLADRIAKPFLLGVVLAALASALWFWHIDHSRALMTAVAVLIVTCPCALSLATPAAMLTTAGALAKGGVLVRRLQALEALTKIDTVIFDKTGTLTEDRMQIMNIRVSDALSPAQAITMAAMLAEHSWHPVSKAIVQHAAEQAPLTKAESQALPLINKVNEIAGGGLLAESNQGQLRLGSAKFCSLATQPLFTHSEVYLSNAQGWLATFTLAEEVKPEATAVVQTLKQMGLTMMLLSGDQPAAVVRVAEQVGIASAQALATPQSKLAQLSSLQATGHRVLMVGDGLNDGPVLAQADVSIAMGKSVPLAQSKSDFVVQSGALMLLPTLLLQAHNTMRIVKQNLLWAAAYNALCVPLAIMGYLPAWLAGLGMATSSLVVIVNAACLVKLPANTAASIDGNAPPANALNA